MDGAGITDNNLVYLRNSNMSHHMCGKCICGFYKYLSVIILGSRVPSYADDITLGNFYLAGCSKVLSFNGILIMGNFLKNGGM